MAKVPRRNRIPSRLGSLRMDRNADLIPGLWMSPHCEPQMARSASWVEATSMTLLTEWLFNASQLSAAMQWYDNPFLTISSVAVVFLWFAPVIDTMNAAKPLTSLLKVEFSWPAGIPKTIGVAEPMEVPGTIVMFVDASAMYAPALNAWAPNGAISVVKLLPVPRYLEIAVMMLSMFWPLPPNVLSIRMKLWIPWFVASLIEETTKSSAPGSMFAFIAAT